MSERDPRTVLLISNLDNGDAAEDKFLARALNAYFPVQLCHIRDVMTESLADCRVLIRNVWPLTHQREFVDRIDSSIPCGTRVYNPLVGKADQRGKGYLATLYENGFPVIPTVVDKRRIDVLPLGDRYVAKPAYGCDGHGQAILRRGDIQAFHSTGFVFQPFIEFTSEVSLYFIDNRFQYALETRNRLDPSAPINLYSPTATEIGFVDRFVCWNALPFGLQRVDVLRAADGGLLLCEIEDFCPYLYLREIAPDVAMAVIRRLAESIAAHILND